MWWLFFAAAAASLLLLTVPGFFVFRTLGFNMLASAVCSPLASMFLCSVVTAALWKLDFFCTWWVLFLTCLVLALAFFSIFTVVRRNSPKSTADGLHRFEEGGHPLYRFANGVPCLLLYLVVAAIAYIYMFVLNVDDAASFVQYYDGLHHIGSIQTFLLSGNWSSFGVTCYPAEVAGGISPTGTHSSSFYPSAWHCVAAFASSMASVEVAIAENASIAVFVVVVFPSGMFLLLRKLFPDKPLVVLCGAVCSSAFAFYPWRLMTFGPLFPNLAAMSQIPAAVFVFISLTEKGIPHSKRVGFAIAFVVALGALAFSQPNAVFTLGVFVAPYLVVLASRIPISKEKEKVAARSRVLYGLAAAVAIVGVWLVCYKLPFLQSVIAYSWDSYASVFQAICDVLLMRFLYHPPQPVLSLFVLVGILSAWHDRRRMWLVFSLFTAACMYVAVASSDGPIRHMLGGFWYTDPNRVISFLVMFAMPLASWGLATACEAFAALVRRVNGAALPSARYVSAGSSCVVLIAFAVVAFWPNYLLTGSVNLRNAFDVAGSYMRDAFQDSHNGFYDQQEREFVQEAMLIVGEDETMANVPCDGSACAFGADGASVLYRFYGVANPESELEASVILRNSLCDIASSSVVRAAAAELHVGYVLKLDRGSHEGVGMYDYRYDSEQWQGIEAVDDDTPGFEVVLAEGDMRLYRITAE